MWTNTNLTLKPEGDANAENIPNGAGNGAEAEVGYEGARLFRWNRNAVRRLEEDAAWALTSNASGAAEVAGVLLGRCRSPVEIEDCKPLFLLQQRDHDYALSGPGKREFERAIAQSRSNPEGELSVIGFYRSDTGNELALTDQDVGLLHTCFRNTCQVTLLFQVGRDQSYSARLFSGDNGRMVADLHSGGNGMGPRWLALWQDLSLPNTAEISNPVETAAAPAEVVEEVRPAEPSVKERRSLRIPIIAGAALAALALLATYPLLKAPAVNESARTTAAAPSRAQSGNSVDAGLALQAAKHGDQLQLDWNRGAPMIANASSGVLTIQEGNAHERRVMLDGSLLRSGTVVYRPVEHPVFVRLVIFDKDGTRLDESVAMYPRGGSGAVIPAGSEPKKESK